MTNINTKNKNILFWSPLLGHVGTLNAVIGMANALNSYKKYNRRLKICRIFTTDISNKNIITSVSKSGPVNSPKNIDSSNFSEFFSKNLFLDEKQTFKYII